MAGGIRVVKVGANEVFNRNQVDTWVANGPTEVPADARNGAFQCGLCGQLLFLLDVSYFVSSFSPQNGSRARLHYEDERNTSRR